MSLLSPFLRLETHDMKGSEKIRHDSVSAMSILIYGHKNFGLKHWINIINRRNNINKMSVYCVISANLQQIFWQHTYFTKIPKLSWLVFSPILLWSKKAWCAWCAVFSSGLAMFTVMLVSVVPLSCLYSLGSDAHSLVGPFALGLKKTFSQPKFMCQQYKHEQSTSDAPSFQCWKSQLVGLHS